MTKSILPAKLPAKRVAATPKASPPRTARQTAAVYRVNARLDSTQAGKLAYLSEATGQSASDVMREAVDRYYEQVKSEKGKDRRILNSLIGKYEGGPADLSENYKQYLTESLTKKHGHR
jgi:Ribbon-helix-helix protein, copG family